MQKLNILSNRLLDLIKLFYLCQIGTCNSNTYLNFDFNLKKILQRGKGIISEIVGRHVVYNKFPPFLLTLVDTEQQESNININPLFKEFYDALQLTRKSLPKSLETDILLINAAWEAISLFNKDPEDVKNFEASLKFCAKIENAILKQGITSMIWHTSINKKVAALTNLIEKVVLKI
jgi:hypothetical protein